jgi:hypothetical protein
VQAGVEALQQLGVELRGLKVAERRQDVEPDQVLVALAGGVLERRDLDPLLDRLADGDAGLRCWSSSTCCWSLVAAFCAAS